MDQLGFLMQVRVGIRRFYLVPLLTLISLFIGYVRSDGWVPNIGDMVGSMLAFFSVLVMHFFMIHKNGPETDDMSVNVAVEGVRHNPIFLVMRVLCFCLFVILVAVQSIWMPWRIPISFIEFFFLFYPVMIYQQDPPPRHELKLAR